MSEAAFTLGGRSFRSRLIVGSGKYASLEQTLACTRESGAEMITVALRRVDLSAPKGENLLEMSPDQRHMARKPSGPARMAWGRLGGWWIASPGERVKRRSPACQ